MKFFVALAVWLGLTFTGGTTAFAQACKGMSQSACTSSASCSYVNGFTRKNGARVKAFCRSKPGKRAASRSTAKKASATRKSSTSSTRRSTTRTTSKGRETTKTSARRTTKKAAASSKKRTSKKRKSATAGS